MSGSGDKDSEGRYGFLTASRRSGSREDPKLLAELDTFVLWPAGQMGRLGLAPLGCNSRSSHREQYSAIPDVYGQLHLKV
jgi:hypothetical protein